MTLWALMTCAPPDMVVPMAFCNMAVDDERSMMTCCNMKNRRAKDVDDPGGQLRGDQSEIGCENLLSES